MHGNNICIDKELYFKNINNLISKLDNEKNISYEIYHTKQKNEEQFIKTIKELEVKNLKLEEENTEKNNLLNAIYNSKRWIYVEKVKNVINKFRGKSKQKN